MSSSAARTGWATLVHGSAALAERHQAGILDTCAYIDLDLLDPEVLPEAPELTAITMAELHQGVAMARDATTRTARTEKLGAAIVDFVPLPFDGEAATRRIETPGRVGWI
jgi:toxin FitB